MPVSTRKSLARAADDLASTQEDVTTIMNDLADNKTPISPRKRGRSSGAQEDAGQSPRKKIAVEVLVPSTTPRAPVAPSPRVSGRLKARASLAAGVSTNRRNEWDLPEDMGENTGANRPIELLKRVRVLGNSKEPGKSPFKGKGTVQTKSTTRVNLDDSPVKRTATKDLSKVAESLRRTGRPPMRKLHVIKSKASNAQIDPRRSQIASSMAGDPFEEAQNDQDDPLTPGLGLRQNAPAHNAQGEFSPLKKDRRAIPDLNSGTAPHRLERPMRLERRTLRPVNVEEGETAGRLVLNPVSTEEVQPEVDDSADAPGYHTFEERDDPRTQARDTSEIRAPSQQPAESPETEAQRRAKEAAKAKKADATRKKKELEKSRKAEERLRAKETALRGIEQAVRLHCLTEPWAELLEAAARIIELRSSGQPESARGKGIFRRLRNLVELYRELTNPETSSREDVNVEIQEEFKTLKSRYTDLVKLKSTGLEASERMKTILDVYQHSIPGMLKLARVVLKAHFHDNDLTVEAHRELFEVLKLALKFVGIAQEWDPQPELEPGLGNLTFHSIEANLEAVKAGYEAVIIREEARLYRERLYVKQKADLDQVEASYRRKIAEVRARRRQEQEEEEARYEKGKGQLHRHGSQRYVYDVDDINGLTSGEFETVTRDHRGGASEHHRGQTLTRRARPAIKREPTEEIPPPSQYKLTDAQEIVLINALREFRGESRFEDIIDAYGGANGELRDFDMDQIMSHAQWIKQSMATLLSQRDEFDGSWDWLRSVPS